MTAAPFILCLSWCAVNPRLGAQVVPPGRAAVAVSGGFNVLLPTLSLTATAGVTRRFDVTAQYDIHAGLVHVFGLDGRVRLSRSWATSLGLSYGFFAVEEINGIHSSRSPFGNGLFVTPALRLSRFTRGGVHLAMALGLGLRVLRVQETDSAASERVPEFTAQHAFAEIAAEWERRHGGLTLSARMLVPIQADFHVLGYLPWVTIGRSWDLP